MPERSSPKDRISAPDSSQECVHVHCQFAEIVRGHHKHEDVLLCERRVWPRVPKGSKAPPPFAEDQVLCRLGSGKRLAERRDDSASALHPSGRSCACGADLSSYTLLALFDGHNGIAAACYAADTVAETLEALLPPGVPLEPHCPRYTEWAGELQAAMVRTLVALEAGFAAQGIEAGCTATLVLVVGRLVTCAAVGDSRCIVDTGHETLALTVDHRLASHAAERARVVATGALVAPVDACGRGPALNPATGLGPLRVWPGGLCLSRTIGDFDVGECVLALPHLSQVLLPESGGRIVLASDGVWDAWAQLGTGALRNILRHAPLKTAAARMVGNIVLAFGGLRDDASVVVADVTPASSGDSSWPAIARRLAGGANRRGSTAQAKTKPKASSASSSPAAVLGCFCFGSNGSTRVQETEEGAETVSAAVPEADPQQPELQQPTAQAELLVDVDMAAAVGLMPGGCPPGAQPAWCTEEVACELVEALDAAAATWRAAAYGSAAAKAARYHQLLAGEAVPAIEALPLPGTHNMDPSVSQRYQGAVCAASAEAYSQLFSPYSRPGRPSLGPQPPVASPAAGAASMIAADVSVRLCTPRTSQMPPVSTPLQEMLAAFRSAGAASGNHG